jgi:CheY-like chemotaxis protein
MAPVLLLEEPMKTLLLVDSDRFNHAMAICAFAPRPEFHLLMASNYLEALWLLCEQEVDLVLVQVAMPEREGLELLTYLANYRPRIPVLTLSRPRPAAEPALPSGKSRMGSPLQMYELISQVDDCLKNSESGQHRPLELQDFLRILLQERETCILRVKLGLESGEFHFCEGRIAHAGCGHLKGESAVRHMLSREGSWFRVEAMPTRMSKLLPEQTSTAKSLS